MTKILFRTTFAAAATLISLIAVSSPAQTTSQKTSPASALVSDGASSTDVSSTSLPPNLHATPVPTTARPVKQVKATKVKKAKKEKKVKPVRVAINRGVLTVDGLSCRAALNYRIDNLRYMYMYVPGSGTIVVSRNQFPGAVEQKAAFHDQMLTVSAGGHVAELSSDGTLVSKKRESAWVRLDSAYRANTRYPVFGFGDSSGAPYAWPGAMATTAQEKGVSFAPPIPRVMLQTTGAQALPISMITTRSAASNTTASLSGQSQN